MSSLYTVWLVDRLSYECRSSVRARCSCVRVSACVLVQRTFSIAIFYSLTLLSLSVRISLHRNRRFNVCVTRSCAPSRLVYFFQKTENERELPKILIFCFSPPSHLSDTNYAMLMNWLTFFDFKLFIGRKWFDCVTNGTERMHATGNKTTKILPSDRFCSLISIFLDRFRRKRHYYECCCVHAWHFAIAAAPCDTRTFSLRLFASSSLRCVPSSYSIRSNCCHSDSCRWRSRRLQWQRPQVFRASNECSEINCSIHVTEAPDRFLFHAIFSIHRPIELNVRKIPNYLQSQRSTCCLDAALVRQFHLQNSHSCKLSRIHRGWNTSASFMRDNITHASLV